MPQIFFQLIRFLGIGFLNTALDFAVLNFLTSLVGVYRGYGVGFLNVVSFLIAVLHSYFWNKYWAFGSTADQSVWRNLGKFVAAACGGAGILGLAIWGARAEYGFVYYFLLLFALFIFEVVLWKAFRLSVAVPGEKRKQEFLLFVIVSIIGTAINSGIVGGVTTFLSPMFGFNQKLWLNFVKAAATAVSLVWNFVGYKLLVFKK